MNAKRLQHELKKRRPFDSPEQEASLNLVRTSDLLQIRFTRLFRQHRLTPSQYNVLRILRGEGKPLPILEIADRTVNVVPGITGLIDRLERAGLVQRDRSPQDRRVIFVAITPRGTKLVNELDKPVLALHKHVLGHLAPAELKEVSRLMEKIRQPLVSDS
jgi:DNA-binding MarR family transcriptional regulator